MRIKFLSTVICLLLAVFLFDSCSKYEDGPMFSLRTKKARLTNGEWEVIELNGFNVSYSEILEFKKDGDFYIDNRKCGTWSFTSGKKELGIDYGILEVEWTILRLTNEEFWFEDESGDEYHCEKIK